MKEILQNLYRTFTAYKDKKIDKVKLIHAIAKVSYLLFVISEEYKITYEVNCVVENKKKNKEDAI